MSCRTRRFSRTSRLTKPSEYKEVFNSAKRFADKNLLVLVRPNQLDYARLGLAISKKRIPTAVARNRLKRLIRERFRREQEMLSGFDVVILAQKDISYLNSKLINGSLSELWGRILKCEK